MQTNEDGKYQIAFPNGSVVTDLTHVYVDSQTFVSDLYALVSSIFIQKSLSLTLCEITSGEPVNNLDWTLDLAKQLIETLMFSEQDDYKLYL